MIKKFYFNRFRWFSNLISGIAETIAKEYNKNTLLILYEN